MSFMSLGKATISIRITQLMSNLLLVAERCGLAKSYPSPHVLAPTKGPIPVLNKDCSVDPVLANGLLTLYVNFDMNSGIHNALRSIKEEDTITLDPQRIKIHWIHNPLR